MAGGTVPLPASPNVSIDRAIESPIALGSLLWFLWADFNERKNGSSGTRWDVKAFWCEEEIFYDGTQLQPLFAYRRWGLLGDSVVAWKGPCHVTFEHMVDVEDILSRSAIAGAEMVHFIVEVFDRELATGVLLQRLFASLVKDILTEMSPILEGPVLVRDGDDLYWDDRKLSISIASQSAVSTMMHFAVNISNQGTPVKTASLEDFHVKPKEFAEALMAALTYEWESVLEATQKVRPL